MANVDTAPLVELTPGDGAKLKGIANMGSASISVTYTITTPRYGPQSLTITLQAGHYVPNDCQVTSATGTVHGWLRDDDLPTA